MTSRPRTLRVASVQAVSDNLGMERNLARAGRHVAEAVDRGAQLVLCPEFLAAGYVFEERIWEAGEPEGGLTETWLAGLARDHRVVVGATFLEAEGDHFYNTFSLYGPDGRLGRVRKQSLPFFEGWFFTPCPRPKIVETPLGRLGVGICNDNQTAAFLRHVAEQRPDLLLMPHSAPTPHLLPRGDGAFARLWDSQLRSIAPRYARALGVPVVMSNKVSSGTYRTPVPILPGVSLRLGFRGYSSIHDSDGSRLAELVGEEGVLVETVTLDPARKRTPRAPRGYFSFGPAIVSRPMGGLLRALDALGQRAYGRNPRRAAAARAAAARPAERAPARVEPPR